MYDDEWAAPPPIPKREEPVEPVEPDEAEVTEEAPVTAPEEPAAAPEEPVEAPEKDGEPAAEPAGEKDASAEEPAEETSEPTEDAGADPVLEAVGDLRETLLGELGALRELFKKKIDRNEFETATLKNQTEEIERYRAGVYDKIMTPLLLKVVDVADKMGTTVTYARSQDDPDASVGLEDFETYRDMLVELLEDYSVRPFSPEVGDRFESGRHRVVSRVTTGDRSLHQRVAEVLSQGYELNGSVISQASVKVYGYKEGAQA